MPESVSLVVPKKLGEKAIRLVTELDLFNRELQIQQTEKCLQIPLISEPSPAGLRELKTKLGTFNVSVCDFERKKQRLLPLDLLKNKLPLDLLELVPHAIDFVGDIAIVEIPEKLAEYKTLIGETILTAHKQTNTVLAKAGAIKGIYRIRDLEFLAGTNKTSTIYVEYGNTLHVDVAKAYFSPRLSNEHNRVASQVTPGETVVDLFAGVGPFVIPIAKNQKKVHVYAVDVNPDAVSLLEKNVKINRVQEQIVPLLGDARKVVKEQLYQKADRVIMNLPETAVEFVDVACEAIKPDGGVVHYYCFVYDSPKPLETAKTELEQAVKQNNRQVSKYLFAKTVREVAPYAWQVVVDAQIQ
ncbi:MAG: class I SAM-dependent methyltransferase family protein [Candidatus Bathyarchaeota archaeon]|nr:MAG: class I SAM-dependent methyltransferase family protein [Candidatus Bathyarchaeota archaeon]